MAIQPIDLQTMYQQLSNVSKTVQSQQQAQLAESIQQQNSANKNLENMKKVNHSEDSKSISSSINENGSNSQNFSNQHKKNLNKNDESLENENQSNKNPYNPYLGSIIDITR